ncbi:4-alpha-glucanotransferase [Shewanella psychrophila]|uniref:4-alpha-glucanotransferase n=1 Tax=Shewanella psychrophila TaxID=225848 RepID=A0A1S6HPP1_9GAMM|nr:4-alpha-glucanotransferase [Shewanella psychrophila]AQS37469.1 4-alpha-glucanotransferase [Shewanella psychrophila]
MGLEKLLYLQGVGAEFINFSGQNVRVPVQDREGVLRCMLNKLVDTRGEIDEGYLEQRIHELDAKPWTMGLHGFQHTYMDEPEISLYLPSGYQDTLTLRILSEAGGTFSLRVLPSEMRIVGDYCIGKTQYLHYRLSLLDLTRVDSVGDPHGSADNPIESHAELTEVIEAKNQRLVSGYHSAELTAGMNSYSGVVMMAPRQAFRLSNIDSDIDKNSDSKTQPRSWGVSIQLYSLRSDSQWGIGDFGDLTEIIELVAAQGGDFIQLNPLHALDITEPDHVSPYSPSDRRRINPLYIHIQGVSEYALVKSQLQTDEFESLRDSINIDNWLDYPSLTQLKYRAFILLYQAFSLPGTKIPSARRRAFDDFVSKEGDALTQFVEAESAKAADDLPKELNFYRYIQFIAEEQLGACQARAKQAGMSLGLIRDLAVGAKPEGIEVQQNESQFCLNASIGAPADPFASQGQNWGLAPLDPLSIKKDNFQHVITIIRANMRHCGALRIDHVMSLLRMWWCPLDKKNGEGAYVYYPVDCLFAILCLESWRARCCIIGEDLGLVPPEMDRRLRSSGIYSNQLFYFCKHSTGFTDPNEHKQDSLMMLANHDVPNLAAWWSTSDLHLRRQLELIDNDEALGDALSGREDEKRQLLNLLISLGCIDEATADSLEYEALLIAWISASAQSHSALFSVQLSDLIGDMHSVNIPGTWQEYPNWQRRLPMTLADIHGSPRVKHLLEQIRAARNSEI